MKRCKDCGRDNEDTARFCGQCGSALSDACRSCGAELPGHVAFCPSCGTAVAAEDGSLPEERRFITVLFADLVGFTAASDEADPEDVRARLVPYHDRVRREIERYGGAIEKLIGDGVMGVFGVPTAHEDDPERAIRAALRIQAAVGRLNEQHPDLALAVRIGVNSGVAVISSGGGERIVGDVVNTASRIEQVAAPGAVVVGESTHRATAPYFDWELLDPVEVKGKSEPLRAWRAIAPVSRYGVDAVSDVRTPFLGRETEHTQLTDTFVRVLHDSTLRLVTIAGAPGVGKTRLVREFFRFVDGRPELVWWRQGRCLPYGEGVTFWALGEIVKAQAGLLESDDAPTAASRLHKAVAALIPDESEAAWVWGALAPLVGAAGEGAVTTERAETFAAWRRFLEQLALANPLVMVIEDLHWADGALVEFLEYLLDFSTDVPIIIVCTARPELYERHPGWGGGRRNSTTISLGPLADEDIARIIGARMDRVLLPAETQTALLERAGGNPLYAEEFVRMLADRGLLESAVAAADVELPETVQALIGARLDLLSEDERALLQDASVVGKVFWDGALGALAGVDPAGALRSLIRREWIRPVRSSSIDGQQEYAFWHVLTRDIAYSRIPRAARATKHESVAQWVDRMSGERATDQAELLAFHYEQALQYAELLGDADDLTDLKAQTARALTMAGTRARLLDAGAAHSYYVRALELLPDDHVDRAELHMKLGRSSWELGLLDQGEHYSDAARLLLARGDEAAAAEAIHWLSLFETLRGDSQRSDELLDRAVAMVEKAPGPEMAGIYASKAGQAMMAGRPDQVIEWADRAMAIMDPDEPTIHTARVTSFRGLGRYEQGDVAGGLADLRRGREIAEEINASAGERLAMFMNLADAVWLEEGPEAALEVFRDAIALAERRGASSTWQRLETTWPLFDLGRWDEVLEVVDFVLGWDEERGQTQMSTWARTYGALVAHWRGRSADAEALVTLALPAAREIGDPQILGPALGCGAAVAASRGDSDRAGALVAEYADFTADRSAVYRALMLTDVARSAASVGSTEGVVRILTGLEPKDTRTSNSALTGRAVLAEAEGSYDEALELYRETAGRWEAFPHVLEHALALAGVGRMLVATGERDLASERFAQARPLLESLGATKALDELEGGEEEAAAR